VTAQRPGSTAPSDKLARAWVQRLAMAYTVPPTLNEFVVQVMTTFVTFAPPTVPVFCEATETRRQRPQHPSEALLVPGAAKLWQPVCIGDDESPQPQELWRHEPAEESAGDLAQVLFQVPGIGEGAGEDTNGLVDVVGGGEDDLSEQPILIGEVLVDGLLRDASDFRDLVHAGADVPLLQEYGCGCVHYRPVFSSRPARCTRRDPSHRVPRARAQRRLTASGRASTVLDRLVPVRKSVEDTIDTPTARFVTDLPEGTHICHRLLR